ncbi:hypothetical protein ACFQ68_16460 [Amycolatopsis japonica]|uniref:hypothetical protein n=1 Tax=Amycolatopsis japonica TaxID=208439 RepID=UPI00366CD053
MAKTQVNQSDVNIQAGKHEQTAEEVDTLLTRLKGDVDNVLAASKSDATRALSSVTDQWIADVRKTVLTNLKAMAGAMRTEVNEQIQQSSDNTQSILNVPMPTANFLS